MTHSNSNEQATPEAHEAGVHFIHTRIKKEIAAGQVEQVITRFPPEPNGFLHLGHAKAIVLNFSMAETFGGHTNLRFDDTNPAKEEQRYIDAIKQDVQWLGYAWKHECYASDYFDTLYGYALHLIDAGLAYVDGQDAEVIKAQRGTLTEPGTPSPDRDRSVDENRDLFERMRAGEFEDGAYVLRAKIDMAAPNINLRDPILYRIRRQHHYRTGDRWCIYPTYDFTHGQSDAIEHITHSLCSLEFEDHRPLYDWFIEHLPVPAKPKQIEFARLNIDFTVLSKRRLTRLVDEGHVEGWDDPRMPTIAGLRRRGFTPEAIRHFCHEIGVTKAESVIPFGVLERNLRDDLNVRAERRMAVLKPLKVVLTNFDAGQTEHATLPNHPQDPSFGERQVPITQTLFIEQDDFMEDAPKKFFRLKPGGEVRLRGAFIIRCDEVIHDSEGQVVALHCSFDPESRSGLPGAERKVKGTIHWVSAEHAVPARVHLYDRLFSVPHPAGDKAVDFVAHLNPDSVERLDGAMLEPSLADWPQHTPVQFERLGYFVQDINSLPSEPVFNRSVTLRDAWAKVEKELRAQNT
ncbi:MAG: glutamine--tRNA ligase/YqeY domain fusion protein [Wenzhouxiangella sp.]|nr:glutamine--tRNA ligase/YqeY domain fusion protein [Wenzhouxiangella sp.]